MSDDITRRIEDLQKRHTALVQEKAGLQGQLKAKKEELAKIVEEIKAAGYDPKQITQERDRVKKELEVAVSKLETEYAEVEAALAAFKK